MAIRRGITFHELVGRDVVDRTTVQRGGSFQNDGKKDVVRFFGCADTGHLSTVVGCTAYGNTGRPWLPHRSTFQRTHLGAMGALDSVACADTQAHHESRTVVLNVAA